MEEGQLLHGVTDTDTDNDLDAFGTEFDVTADFPPVSARVLPSSLPARPGISGAGAAGMYMPPASYPPRPRESPPRVGNAAPRRRRRSSNSSASGGSPEHAARRGSTSSIEPVSPLREGSKRAPLPEMRHSSADSGSMALSRAAAAASAAVAAGPDAGAGGERPGSTPDGEDKAGAGPGSAGRRARSRSLCDELVDSRPLESGPLFAGQPRQLDEGERLPVGRHSYTPQKARTIGPSDVEVRRG